MEGRWKLIRHGPSDGWRHELYDLTSDPGELRDRSQDAPDELSRMVRRLDEAFRSVPSIAPRRGMALEDGTWARTLPTSEREKMPAFNVAFSAR